MEPTNIGPNCLSPPGHMRPLVCSASKTFLEGRAAALGAHLSFFFLGGWVDKMLGHLSAWTFPV
jgi:hypothetical protein